MGNFEVKYRAGSEVKSVVLDASDELAAGKAFASSHHGISPNNVISVRNLSTAYRSNYGAALFAGKIISYGGWIVFALGLLGVLVGLATTDYANTLGLNPILSIIISGVIVMFSLLYALIGLFMAAVGQHFRATVDTANYNGEMLALMRSGKA